MTTTFITHPDCLLHDMGAYHPECPARLSAIHEHLTAQGLVEQLDVREAPYATQEELSRAHNAEYIRHIEASAPANSTVHLDPDTAMNPYSWQAALRSAGAGVLAVDLLMRGEANNAFCAVRPPGHHAGASFAMGFCFFNNIAVAARHALEAHGLQRVAIVDFDVHHGNGTEDIVSGDERMLMCGSFQHPYYPFSGTEPWADNMHNVPLPFGTGSDAFRAAVEEVWIPRLADFEPEMLFVSAGFDAHSEDDMAGLQLNEDDYTWCTRMIKMQAETSAKGHIVSMLEGGYALDALARSVAAHIRTLANL